MIPDYRDPWRSYGSSDPDDAPEDEPRKRAGIMARFVMGLPFVFAFWIVCAVLNRIT